MIREEKKKLYVPPEEREYKTFFDRWNGMCYEEVI